MTIRLHRGDLPDIARYKGSVAVDTEAMGLDARRDRLCVVQLSPGDGSADVVQIPAASVNAPNLKRLLTDPSIEKIFHFARFDLAHDQPDARRHAGPGLLHATASRLARTYTDKHGLKDLARELLGIDMSKQQQSSDWGADKLSDAQLAYAASDVLLSPRAQGQARRHAGPRGPRRTRRGLLPLPARPRPARPRRLGGRGHFRPFLSALARAACGIGGA